MLVGGDGGGRFGAIPGDPGAVRHAATAIGRSGAGIGEQAARIRGAAGEAGSSWRGEASGRFQAMAAHLATAPDTVETFMAGAASALIAFAAELEACQQELARAETMADHADADYASTLASIDFSPVPPGDTHAAGTRRAALASAADAHDQATAQAARLADGALTRHREAVARLAGQMRHAQDGACGLEKTLCDVGDRLGIPASVTSGLATVAFARSSARYATLEPALERSAALAETELVQTLATDLVRGRPVEEIAQSLESYDHALSSARTLFTNADREDLVSGGLESLGRFAPAAKWAGRGAGVLGIVGDAYTMFNPDEKGAWGTGEQVAAGVNAGATGGLLVADMAGMTAEGGLLAASGSLFWVPVAGQVAVIGTGVFLAGDYLYTHTRWFKDAVDTTGHAIAASATAYWHGEVGLVKGALHGVQTAGNFVGHVAGGIGHDTYSAVNSVATFLGL